MALLLDRDDQNDKGKRNSKCREQKFVGIAKPIGELIIVAKVYTPALCYYISSCLMNGIWEVERHV